VSVGGRGQERQRVLRRIGILAAVLAILALLFLASGHWILGIIFAAAAVVSIWGFFQLRSVR
jgi:hypothetical protein